MSVSTYVRESVCWRCGVEGCVCGGVFLCVCVSKPLLETVFSICNSLQQKRLCKDSDEARNTGTGSIKVY